MGMLADAEQDGIRHEPGERNGWFYIPCQGGCGREIRKTYYSRKRTYLCDYCKGIVKERQKIEVIPVEHQPTKYEIRFDKAAKKITDAFGSGYESSIKVARTRCNKYGSIPEAMLAIVLLKHGYKIIPQQKIGQYSVDFVIPSKKWIIEVDGSIYHKDLEKDLRREAAINYKIGYDWRFIRVPAERITQNAENCIAFIELEGIRKP